MRASFWLLDASDSLVGQSRHNPDGTGLGWFDADAAPHVYKRPIAAFQDLGFASDARDEQSRTFVAHVRFASNGGLTEVNTHPFCLDDRLFAHNGVIGDLPALERRLGAGGLARVQGETDSERFFALITEEIDRHGGDTGAGIVAAATWVVQNLPVLSINFVLTTATDLWALRYPQTHTLFVLERPAGGGAGGPDRALEHASSLGTRVHAEHGRTHPLVVVASERMDNDPGWRELRSGELLHVGPELETETTLAIAGPPAHVLTPAQLDDRARASQSPAGTGTR